MLRSVLMTVPRIVIHAAAGTPLRARPVLRACPFPRFFPDPAPRSDPLAAPSIDDARLRSQSGAPSDSEAPAAPASPIPYPDAMSPHRESRLARFSAAPARSPAAASARR